MRHCLSQRRRGLSFLRGCELRTFMHSLPLMCYIHSYVRRPSALPLLLLLRCITHHVPHLPRARPCWSPAATGSSPRPRRITRRRRAPRSGSLLPLHVRGAVPSGAERCRLLGALRGVRRVCAGQCARRYAGAVPRVHVVGAHFITACSHGFLRLRCRCDVTARDRDVKRRAAALHHAAGLLVRAHRLPTPLFCFNLTSLHAAFTSRPMFLVRPLSRARYDQNKLLALSAAVPLPQVRCEV